MRSPIYIGSALGAFVCALGVTGCNPQQLAAGGGTVYSPQYSESAFRSIKVGDRWETVISALGQPLANVAANQAEEWHYYKSPGKTSLFTVEVALSAAPEDFTHLTFDRNGFVTEIRGQFLQGIQLGMVKSAVKDAHGTPQYIVPPEYGTWVEFSAPADQVNKSHHQRRILLDRDGVVTKIERGFYYD